MPIRLKDVPESKKDEFPTPSQYPFPVFAMCPPAFVDNKVKNNVTMDELKDQKIDKNKFLAQWNNLYNVLAANSLVLVIPPVKGLQDQTYVNSFSYLPHLRKRNVVVLSNFTAEGRSGEEQAAGVMLKALNYEIVKCPFRFEGEPELKYIRDNIYIGGYGFRSDPRAFKWLEEKFGCKIIAVKETDEILYHLDCSVFPFGEYHVMLCAEIMDRKEVAEIEKVATIHPVSVRDAYEGICNCIKVEDAVFNSSPLAYMRRTDEGYQEQKHKNETLERICEELGQELMYIDLSECEASGAKASCFVAHLNYIF